MKELLGLISVLLYLIGCVPYIIDTIRKKTKPHIFTWLIWSIVTTLAFLGQYAKGGGAGSWSTGVAGLMALIITILSLKNGTKDINLSDKLFFIGALLAIIPWYVTKDPTLSIFIVIVLDACALLPTVRKTYKDPKSETFTTYFFNFIRQPLSIAALRTYNIATLLYPIYLFIANFVMMVIIRRLRHIKEKKNVSKNRW